MVVPREDNLTIEGFKGLNTAVHPTLIGDDQFSELLNFSFDKAGSIFRRRGLYIEIDMSLRSVTPAWTPSISMQVFGSFDITTAPGGHYYLGAADGKPWVATSMDFDELFLVTGLSVGHFCVGVVQYNNIWYFITSGGVYKATPGPTPAATLIANSPKGAAYCLFKDRLWIVQVDNPTTASLSSTISFCAPGNFEAWDPADIQKVASGIGDVITCLIPYADRIIVFKKFSIWNMFLQGGDFPISAVRLLTSGRGAISTRSVVVVNEIIYFMAHDGVYRTDGNAFSEISDAVQNYFEFGPARFAYDQEDWIAYHDDHLFIKATSPTFDDALVLNYGRRKHPASPRITDQEGYYYLSYNIPADAWSEEVYPLASQIGTLTRPANARNTNGDMMFLQGAKDRVYSRHNSYWTDDLAGTHTIGSTPVWTTVSIPVTFITKRISADRQSRVKRLKYAMIGIDGDNNTPELSYIVDGKLRDTSHTDENIVSDYGTFKFPGCGYFRTFQLKMYDNTKGDLRVDMLHFVMHTKRQLTDSPR